MKPDAKVFVVYSLLILIIVAGCTELAQKKDDWVYTPGGTSRISQIMPRSVSVYNMAESDVAGSFGAAASLKMGYSVGGAKDINNFRENIKNNYLPLLTDITYEGLFYDYFFETARRECTELFCPSYSTAISVDPLSNETEYHLSVGLGSNITDSSFKRKKLNLVVVMDISGSMGSPFDTYYYDMPGKREQHDNQIKMDSRSKMEIAKESLIALLSHLNDDDMFGLVLFDDAAYLASPLELVGKKDMDKLREHIHELQPRGGTSLSAGIDLGTALFDDMPVYGAELDTENRIIFITDAMPNTDDISESGFTGRIKKNAENKIYTTFIGVGIDMNTELIELITKTRGANYYTVHNADEFTKRMDEGFEYMVTPIVFNLRLILDVSGYKIDEVYGSPEAKEATGELMKVSTLFPSKTDEMGTKGGIILLKLRRTDENGGLKLRVEYEDENGVGHSTEEEVIYRGSAGFDDNAIRKGVLLVRYVKLVKEWITHEESIVPRNHDEQLSPWERQSRALSVLAQYKEKFVMFREYFEDEMEEIADESLERELDVLKLLVDVYAPDDDVPDDE